MKANRLISPVISSPVPYVSFEEYVVDIQRVFSKDYGRSLSEKEASEVAKKFDALLFSLV